MADDLMHQDEPQPQPDESAALREQLAQSQQAQQQLAQQNAQYQNYLQQLAVAAQQARQQQQEPPQQNDEDLWADPKKMREQVSAQAEQRAQEMVRQTVAPIAMTYLQNSYASNRQAAFNDQGMPHFRKWETEIYQILSQVDPGAAARYDAWQAAYQLVSTRHLDEIVAERVARAKAAPPEDEDETPEEQPAQVQAQQYRGRETPAPISTALGRASSPVAVKKAPRLNAEEAFYAKISGATPEEYRKYQNTDTEDVLGFNGRDRV